jgi:signal recognition particle subunit SRP54
MFDGLTKNISKAFDGLRGKKVIGSSDIEEAIAQVRIALLEADVALPVVTEFNEKVKEKALGEDVVKGVSPVQMVIKIIQDEIENILKSDNQELNLTTTPPAVILMVGLQGSGKTTSTAKLARLLRAKQNKKVLVASLDVYRPAAQEQLAIMAERAGVDSLEIVKKEKPEKITKRALKEAKRGGYDILLLDSAGRLSIDKELLKELSAVKKISKPIETLLVVDAMTGQDAVTTAKNFNEETGITGIVLTRIDGDARGGAALSMKYVTGAPIKFIGTGEGVADFETLQADRLASRILDMGDITSLVEKAQEVVGEDEMAKMEENLRKGKFDFNDLLAQLKNMKKMGGFSSVLSLVPGAGKIKEAMKNANIDESVIAKQEAIILSMTKYERGYPERLNTSRKNRIAKGSGGNIQQVNQLVKKHKDMQKMMKRMRGMDPEKIKSMMGG